VEPPAAGRGGHVHPACPLYATGWLGGAAKTSTAIGAALIVILRVVVDFLVGVTYGTYRLARRPARTA
jgi:hypothetical protein